MTALDFTYFADLHGLPLRYDRSHHRKFIAVRFSPMM
jgi:hypothetical protein